MKPLLLLALVAPFAVAKDPPATGKTKPAFEAVDKAVLEFMGTIDAQAATVAVSKDGKLLHSRGFGYADKAKKTPTPPDALFRIASCSKPITAAMVKTAVADKKLTLDTKALGLLSVKPPKDADARLGDITVGHLLEHKGGWDPKATFDPMFAIPDVEKELGKRPAKTSDVIAYMFARPLQSAPGKKEAYSNFGYCVLARALEGAVKRPYAGYLEQAIGKPLGTDDIRVGFADPKKRDAREVSYPAAADGVPLDTLDAAGGLVASAPALCLFLDKFWIGGDPRKDGEWGEWTFFGSLPGTTAMTRQRKDGSNVAVLFNNRRDKTLHEDNEALKKAVDAALDGAKK